MDTGLTVEHLTRLQSAIQEARWRKAVQQYNGSTCTHCVGYGMWPDGSNLPMGPLDAEDGAPTIECPFCGANPNPLP